MSSQGQEAGSLIPTEAYWEVVTFFQPLSGEEAMTIEVLLLPISAFSNLTEIG
jgi:hypothetical protein